MIELTIINKNREIANRLLNLRWYTSFYYWRNKIYPGALNLNNLKEIIKQYRES